VFATLLGEQSTIFQTPELKLALSSPDVKMRANSLLATFSCREIWRTMVGFPQRLSLRPILRIHRFLSPFSALSLSILLISGDVLALKKARPGLSHTSKSCNNKISVRSPQDKVQLLVQGQSLSKEMNGGDVHTYRLLIEQDQFAHFTVEQNGINVTLALFDPDRKLVGEMDSPNNTLGPEEISLVALATGEYRLEVRSTESWANPGHYVVSVTELRQSTPLDLKRVAAERRFMEAEHFSDPKEEDLQKQKMSLAQSRQKAIEIYKDSLADWQAVNDAHGETMTYYRLGANYKQLGDFDKAVESFESGLNASRNRASEQDWRLSAGILNDEGVIFISSDVQKALGLFDQAQHLFEAHHDNRGLASSYNNRGVALASTGDMQEALEDYMKSLQIRKSEHQQASEINLNNNIGGIYDSLGDPQLALNYYEGALKLWKDLNNRQKIPDGLNNVAKVHDELGEWQDAKNEYEEALGRYRDAGNRSGEAITLINLGTLYDTLGDSEMALQNYNQALTLLRNVVKNKRLTANVLTRIGQLDFSFDKIDDGLRSYNEALNVEADMHPAEPRSRASTLTALGTAMAAQRNLQKAIEYYGDALDLRRKVGDRRGESVTLDKMGDAYYLVGDQQAALKSFEQAIPIWRSLEDRLGLASSLRGIAKVELERGNLPEAVKVSDEAMEIVEDLRVNVSSEQLRTSYFATKQNYYELQIDLNMRLYQQSHSAQQLAIAFQTSERSRSRSMIDTLSEAGSSILEESNQNLRGIERRIQAKSEARIQLLASKHKDSEVAALTKDLINLTRKYDDAKDDLRIKNPKYAQLTQTKPLTLPEVQKQSLDEDTLLLEYSLGEKRSYVWAVTPDSINGFELPPRKEIETIARRLTESLTERNREVKSESPNQWQRRIGQADADYAEASAALSKMVIDPVAPLMGKRLVIVADGALQLVSFEALPAPKDTNVEIAASATAKSSLTSATNAGRRLIDDHEIVYEPSASVLALQRAELKNRKPAPHAVAVLANPVFDKDDPRVRAASAQLDAERKTEAQSKEDGGLSRKPVEANRGRKRDLTRALEDLGITRFPPLPSSREEADAITKFAPKGDAKEALNFEANRATAMSPELAKYRMIHFATHGVVNFTHPELSGIVLSLVDEKGQPQDGYLSLHDIYNLNLPAELIVLSACETGIGKEIKGEGLIALTRGFMYAGAPRVVASLWKVDDAATATLMAELYKQMLTNGLKPAAALRVAQLRISLQKRWHSPYYWVGFVLQGEWK